MRSGTGWSIKEAVCTGVATVSCPVCHKRRPPLRKEVVEWPPAACCSAQCREVYTAQLEQLYEAYVQAKPYTYVAVDEELRDYGMTYEWYPERVVQHHYDTTMVKGRAA